MRQILLFLLLQAGTGFFSLFGQEPLHLFFTGDIHGVVKSERPAFHGDILRIEKVVEQTAQRDNISKNEMLLLDTGDALSFHYLSQMDSGRTIIRHMIEAGYEGMTVGNLDFKYGLDNLLELAALDSNFTIFGANLVGKDDMPIFTPYRIINKRGLRIGVIGVGEQAIQTQVLEEQREGMKVLAPREVLAETVKKLRPECDLLIALNHMKLLDNFELSREISGIDLIISSGSRDSVRVLRVFDDYGTPRTTIVSAPQNALAVGHVQVDYRVRNGRYAITRIEPQSPLPVEEVSLEGSDLSDYERLEEAFSDYIANRYDGFTPDHKLMPMTNNVEKDLLHFALYTLLKSTHSEIAILNYGSLVTPVLDRNKAYFTIRDIESITRPFDPVVTMRLTGKEIKEIMDRAKKMEPGSSTRLQALAINDYRDSGISLRPHGRELEDDQVYAVATVRFLADGGDGYENFRKGTHLRSKFIGDTRLLAEPVPAARSVPISDLMVNFFKADDYPDFTTDIDFYGESDFLNRPLFLLKFENIDFSFKSVRVNNNEEFTSANDKRVSATTENSTNLATSGYLGAIRLTRSTRWENGVLFRYAFQELGNSGLQESDDRLEFQTIFDWDNPFKIGSSSKLNLYSSLRYDTEFTGGTDDDGFRLPRRQQLYYYLGVSRFGDNDREFRLAFFAKRDFNTQTTDAGFELNLKYFLDFPWGKHGSLLRSRYLFKQPNRNIGDERALIDYTGFLEFHIIQFVSLKPQINVFLFQDMVLNQWATNVQFSVNLSFSRLWKPQYIKFGRKKRAF